ncbi:MAG: class I SAM-dependent methyltransferase [Pseudomonadota bacterium]
MNLADRFGSIYDLNMWGASKSRSGLGSEPAATAAISAQIGDLVSRLNVQSILDAPCGEGFLLENMPQKVAYHGVDIVAPLIKDLSERYSLSSNRDFSVSDICSDPLPDAELAVCRDLLVHLSFGNVLLVLRNLMSSGCSWLLVTHFTEVDQNYDVEDGDWRPLNMTLPPFNFPEPIELLNERCHEANGTYADKMLGLWHLPTLKERVDLE